jgi:Rad3-related DNA helicase
MFKQIETYFPPELKPRPEQIEALRQVQSAWKDSDVIVLQLPTAFGKTAIAQTIMKWCGGAAYVAPNNMLVKQFQLAAPKVPTLYAADMYDCHITCSHVVKGKRKHAPDCAYVKDLRGMMNKYRKSSNTNLHMLVARNLHKETLIVDEAHLAIGYVQSWNSTKVRHSRWKYPRYNGGYVKREELLQWIQSLVNWERIVESPGDGEKGVSVLYKELTSDSPRYIISEKEENYFDRSEKRYYPEKVLALTPVDPRGMYNPLWPPTQVKKLILMSATFSHTDLESLSLEKRRVTWIGAPSPIPPDRRPVTLDTTIGPLNYRNQLELAPQLAHTIGEILQKYPNDKGLVHVTYQMADLLRRHLTSGELPEVVTRRLMFHSKSNKAEVFDRFRESGEAKVLVASGMYEGIDLPYDAGRFQIITKVPWPSLAEPAIKYFADTNPKWYKWQVTKTMLQAYGRICRGTEDFGATYILDGSFERLHEQDASNYPSWFDAAYTTRGETDA